MRTTDALRIGMELGQIRGALDAWEENKHPRADNGQFTSGAGGGGGSPKTQGTPRSTKGKLNVQGLKKVKELQRKSDELGKKLRRTYTHLSDSEKKTVNKAFEAARNGDAAEVKSLLKIDRDDAEHLTDLIKATDDHKQGQDIAAAVFISQAFPTWYHKPGEKVNKAEMVTNMFNLEKKEAKARKAASTSRME